MGRRREGWRRLSWRERGRLLACAAGLAGVQLSLALLGYMRSRSVIETLTRRAPAREANDSDLADAQAMARLAAIAGRHGLVHATCLRQSLFLYGWLRWRGLQPTLQLGISKQMEDFQAHAWVELGGIPLLQSDAGHRAFTGIGQ